LLNTLPRCTNLNACVKSALMLDLIYAKGASVFPIF
jgi:hypothetical protein